MPSVYNIIGYKVYFWSNENNEPFHIHISKGVPSPNATKVWISSSGVPLLAHNKSRIPKKDLDKIMSFLKLNCVELSNMWLNYFGYITYYA